MQTTLRVHVPHQQVLWSWVRATTAQLLGKYMIVMFQQHVSHSLNSLKGDCTRAYIGGTRIVLLKADTRNLGFRV